MIETTSEELVFLVHLSVRPNSRRQHIEMNGEELVIELKSKPQQNKANKELISLLRKKLGISNNQIKIIAGLKSKSKVVRVEFNEAIRKRDITEKLNS